jgi:hypothetical protein
VSPALRRAVDAVTKNEDFRGSAFAPARLSPSVELFLGYFLNRASYIDLLALERVPPNAQAVNLWLRSWAREFDSKQVDFFELLARAYLDAGSSRGTRSDSLHDFVDRLRLEWRSYRTSRPDAESALTQSWRELQSELQKRRFWTEFGEESLRVEFVNSYGEGRIWIGEQSYTAKRVPGETADRLVFLVPRGQLVHPAWNPISDSERMGLLQAERLSFPKTYPVEVGKRGEIYLLDGNKRSELDPRELIPVETSWPPTTVSWRVYLDHSGLVQPSLGEIDEIRNGLSVEEWIRRVHGSK